jgi:hypothetical protein
MAEAESEVVVSTDEFHSFVVRSLRAVGAKEGQAGALADLLVAADTRGHYSHGLNRLGKDHNGHSIRLCSVTCPIILSTEHFRELLQYFNTYYSGVL